MKRPRRSAVVTVTLVAAGALLASAVTLVLASSWSRNDGGTYAPTAPVVSTRLDPPSALFGDPIEAVARILVDRREVDPETVTLDPSFKPFQAFVATKRVNDGIGQAAEIVFSFRLQCVTGACIGAMEEEQRGGARRAVPIPLPASVARGRTRDGERLELPVRWPSAVVHSRLTAEDIALGEPSAPRFYTAPVDHRVAPGRLGWGLVALAVVLVCVAATLIGSVLLARRTERRLRLPANMGALERALALARHALAHDDVDGGRKALERLSAELERDGRAELADEVARIAWSSPGPSATELDDVDRRLRSVAGHA